jgi:predicted nucleotidyltransferase
LLERLERLLGRRVDLVTERGLKPRARRHVEQDLVRVA